MLNDIVGVIYIFITSATWWVGLWESRVWVGKGVGWEVGRLGSGVVGVGWGLLEGGSGS